MSEQKETTVSENEKIFVTGIDLASNETTIVNEKETCKMMNDYKKTTETTEGVRTEGMNNNLTQEEFEKKYGNQTTQARPYRTQRNYPSHYGYDNRYNPHQDNRYQVRNPYAYIPYRQNAHRSVRPSYDAEYSTQRWREYNYLKEHGIMPTFIHDNPKYNVQTYKYAKTPELFETVAAFYRELENEKAARQNTER